jgi:hypothetical protein
MNYALEEFILNPNFKDIPLQQIERFAELIYNKSQIDDSESNIVSYSRTNL